MQELIKEHLRANLGGNFDEDNSEDLTGLRRAAAFFERQSQASDEASGHAIEDADPGQSMSDWLGIVTEEQVSALIHEVWKENENSNAATLSAVVEADPGERDDQEAEYNDNPSESGTSALQTGPEHIGMVAGKAVQAGDAENVQGTEPTGPRPDSQTNAARATRTHLGQLVLALVPEDQAPVTTVPDALRLLRRRRLEQRAQRRRRLLSRPRHTVGLNEECEIFGVKQQDEDEEALSRSSVSRGVKSSRDLFTGSTHSKENYDPPNVAEEAPEDHTAPEPIDNEQEYAEAESLGEQRLRAFDLPLRESWSSSNARSSSSSNAVSDGASSSSGVEGSHIFNAVDRRVRRINTQQHDRRANYRHYCSNTDLSEGEVDPNDPGNTSEGEITGRRREKFANVMNSASRSLLQRPSHHQSSSEGLQLGRVGRTPVVLSAAPVRLASLASSPKCGHYYPTEVQDMQPKAVLLQPSDLHDLRLAVLRCLRPRRPGSGARPRTPARRPRRLPHPRRIGSLR